MNTLLTAHHEPGQAYDKHLQARIHAGRLVDFIRQHGIDAHVTLDAKISAFAVYSDASHNRWETIEPTWQAARDWLGY